MTQPKSIYCYPKYFNITSPGIPGDISFYSEICSEKNSEVLEVGVGLGRIAFQVARRGINIYGIDNSKQMFEESVRIQHSNDLLAKHVKLEFVDFLEFCPGRTFDTIIIPYRTFLHFDSIDKQMEALSKAYSLLDKEGKLVLNIFDPEIKTLANYSENYSSFRYFRSGMLSDNIELITEASTRIDFENQLIYEIWKYIESQDGTILKISEGLFKIRFTFKSEMEYLFKLTGFNIVNFYGGFKKQEFKTGGEQIWICQKK